MRQTGKPSIRALVFLTVAMVAACESGGEPEGQGTVQESASPQNPGPGLEEGDGRRELRKEITIAAPVEQVWAVWTDPEALGFLSGKSNIELRIGGPYEWFLDGPPDEDGRRGGEGCRILAFLPYRVLAFDWSFPPSIPSLRGSQAKTQVVVRFDEASTGTRLRFSQIGWKEGEDWAAGYAYFDEAWDYVLQAMKQHLEGDRPSTASGSADSHNPLLLRLGRAMGFPVRPPSAGVPRRWFRSVAGNAETWIMRAASTSSPPRTGPRRILYSPDPTDSDGTRSAVWEACMKRSAAGCEGRSASFAFGS